MLQGIGVGGEWGGSVLLAMEWSRHHGQRGLVASWPQFGVPCGLFLANLAVLAFSQAAVTSASCQKRKWHRRPICTWSAWSVPRSILRSGLSISSCALPSDRLLRTFVRHRGSRDGSSCRARIHRTGSEVPAEKRMPSCVPYVRPCARGGRNCASIQPISNNDKNQAALH
jgi:MFS family permease